MRKFNFTSNADSSDYKAIDDWKIKRMETKDIVKFWLETTEMLRASTWSDMPRQASSKSYTIEDFKIRRMEITEALSHLEEIEFLWVLYNYGYGYSERRQFC